VLRTAAGGQGFAVLMVKKAITHPTHISLCLGACVYRRRTCTVGRNFLFSSTVGFLPTCIRLKPLTCRSRPSPLLGQFYRLQAQLLESFLAVRVICLFTSRLLWDHLAVSSRAALDHGRY